MRYFIRIFTFLVMLVGAANAYALNVIWDRSGPQDSSGYGYRIAALGDQNGDSIADWAVQAHGMGGDSSYIEYFHGGNPPSLQPYHIITGEIAPWGALEVLGDINGDHYTDWFVRTWNEQHNGYIINIYLGGPEASFIPSLTFSIGGADEFGTVGDFNGDGYSDFFWYHFQQNFSNLYFGSNTLDTLPDWERHTPGFPPNRQALPLAFGDLNGDGFSDWVSADFETNTTFIFTGVAQPDTVPAYMWQNMMVDPTGIIKDMNSDHRDELIYRWSWSAYLMLGSVLLDSLADDTLSFPCTTPEWTASAGDINDDAYGDLLLWTDYCGSSEWGVLAVYLGSSSIGTDPVLVIPGWTAPLNLIGIWTAEGLGDINGDGVGDFAIGAWTDGTTSGYRGRCVILSGDTTLHADADPHFIVHPSSFSLSVYPNPFNPFTTISFAVPKAGRVELSVYDVTGRKAGGLLSAPTGIVAAGEYHVEFNGSDLPSGIYFVRLDAGGLSQTRKMVLLK
jgi:hypothetical protein